MEYIRHSQHEIKADVSGTSSMTERVGDSQWPIFSISSLKQLPLVSLLVKACRITVIKSVCT
jgi:hypothetical protein